MADVSYAYISGLQELVSDCPCSIMGRANHQPVLTRRALQGCLALNLEIYPNNFINLVPIRRDAF